MNDAFGAARYLLINRDNELRCGWRALAFIALSFLALQLVQSIVASIELFVPTFGRLLVPPPDGEGATSHAVFNFLLFRGSLLVAVLVASAICARFLEHRGLGSIGFKFHRGFIRDFGLGLLLGTLAIGLAVLVEAAAGSVTLGWSGRQSLELIASLALLLLMFLIAAAAEELFFRGFAFQALVYSIGPIPSVAIASVAFGLLHLSNRGASMLSTINTVLAGIWLCLAYLKTRSLWLATGLHCAWNVAMVFIFGLPVSGFSAFTRIGLLNGIGGPPIWISGGSYGPEGGIAATLAIVVCTLVVWKAGFLVATDAMMNAIEHGKPEPRFLSIFGPPSNERSTPSESENREIK